MNNRNRVHQFGLLFVIIGSIVSLFGPAKAAKAEYAPSLLTWVENGLKLDSTRYVIPESVASNRGRDRVNHFSLLTALNQNGPYALYYTNNTAWNPGEQGWLSPERVSFAVEPENNVQSVDALGTTHLAWRSKRNAYQDNLDQFKNSISDVWYRSRAADGTWSSETQLTNYANEVAIIASDPGQCQVNEDPYHGRVWWARPAAQSLVMGVESNGTPRFAWSKEWLVVAFDPFTGLQCWNQSNPPAIPLQYQTHLVAKTGSGGSEQTLADAFTGSPKLLIMDRGDRAHLFIEAGDNKDYYTTAISGGGWAPLFEPMPPRGWDILSASDDPSAPNVLHVVMYDYYSTKSILTQIIDGAWQVPEEFVRYRPFSSIAVNHDGHIFLTEGSQITSYSDGKLQDLYAADSPHTGSQFFIDEDGTFSFLGLGGYDYTLEVTSAGLFYGTDNADYTETVSDVGTVNVTNGDFGVHIPLLSLAGLGPQGSLALTYNTLASPNVSPGSLSGWRLNSSERILTAGAENPFGDYAYAWLSRSDGKTILLIKNRNTRDFTTYSWSNEYLLLRQDAVTKSWTLEEANGTKKLFLKSGQIDAVTDASGNALDYRYADNPLMTGAQENLVSIVDEKGRTSRLQYDANNLVIKIFDPENREYRLAYYTLGEVGGAKEHRLLQSITRVRTDGQPNEVWRFDYHDHTDSSAPCSGDPSLSCPSKRTFLKSVTDPAGNATSYYFEIGGRLARVVDPLDQTLGVEYEDINGITLPTCGTGQELSLTRTSITDRRGDTTLYEGSPLTATVWKITDPRGETIEQRYDFYGYYRRLLCRKDKRGAVTTFNWAHGSDFVLYQLSDIHLPGITNPIQYTYTADHEIATVTDPKGNITTNNYADPNNPHLVTSIVEPADTPEDPQATTVITYDAAGRLATRTDPKGTGITTYRYDAPGDQTGLVTSIERAGLTGIEKFTYTRTGLLETHKQPAHPDGILTEYFYDNAYRLERTKIPDPGTGDHGPSSITNVFDENGNLKTVTDQLRLVTTYDYDVLNRQIKTTRHDGTFATTEYDANGNVTKTTDWNGNATERDYDALNRMSEERKPENEKKRLTYDENGNITQEKEVGLDGSERVTAYAYDQLNRLTSVTDPSPFQTQTESYTYDDNSNLVTVTDRRGNVAEYRYTNRDLLSAIKRNQALVDPEYEIEYEYDLNGNRTIAGVWRNDDQWVRHDTINEYDPLNRLKKIIDPLDRETTFVYDDNGNLADTTDPSGMITRVTYDNLNRAKTTVNDFGRLNLTSRTKYDAAGNVVESTDAENHATTYTYDDVHRLTTETSPLGLVATYWYDSNGNMQDAQDGLNHFTSYFYDRLNRLAETRDANGVTNQRLAYDEFGNLKTRTDGNGLVTTYTTDELHRPTTTAYPTYSETRTYDENSNVKTVVDPRTNESYDYDPLNRATAVTDNLLNRRIEYDYDTYDQKTEARVKVGGDTEETRSYVYDAAGKLDTLKSDAQIFDYDYNADGTRQKLTRPDGSRTDYLYDTAKRLTDLNNKKQDAAVISGFHYAFDNVGNRTRMDVTLDNAAHHSVQYGYDVNHRITSETRTGANPYVNSWQYDLADNRTFQNKNGEATSYVYDDANQLITEVGRVTILADDFEAPPLDDTWTSVSGTWTEQDGILRASETTASKSGPRGLLQGLNINESSYSMDIRLKETTGITAWKGLAFHIQDPDHYLIAETAEIPASAFSCSIGNTRCYVVRIGQVVNGVVTKLAYKLVQADDPWVKLSIDVNGASVTLTVNENTPLTYATLPYTSGGVGVTTESAGEFDDVHLTKSVVTSCAYDDNGNQTSCGDEQFSYDPENRLASFTKGETSATYSYDAFGRRIAKSVNGAASERYFYEDNDVIRDLDESGNVVTRYVNGLGIDERLAMAAGASLNYYLTDALNSTREVTDSSGAVVNRYDYEAFGLPLEQSGSLANRYQFTGREWDAESGKDYYRARMYDPNQGRFMGRDTKRTDMNLYAYVRNNPLIFSDPLGEDVYFVARQFTGATKEEFVNNKERFKKGGKFSTGHGYLLITRNHSAPRPENVIATYSWHPDAWPEGAIDANEGRPGRVWKNHPFDVNLTTKWGAADHKKWLITDDLEAQKRLINRIELWIKVKKAGYEEGQDIPDKKRKPGVNEIGKIDHKDPDRTAPKYWVCGQNCFWWATTMLSQTNIKIKPETMKEIDRVNLGIGPSGGLPQLPDNETMRDIGDTLLSLFLVSML